MAANHHGKPTDMGRESESTCESTCWLIVYTHHYNYSTRKLTLILLFQGLLHSSIYIKANSVLI